MNGGRGWGRVVKCLAIPGLRSETWGTRHAAAGAFSGWEILKEWDSRRNCNRKFHFYKSNHDTRAYRGCTSR
jgi:hypothetical protein